MTQDERDLLMEYIIEYAIQISDRCERELQIADNLNDKDSGILFATLADKADSIRVWAEKLF